MDNMLLLIITLISSSIYSQNIASEGPTILSIGVPLLGEQLVAKKPRYYKLYLSKYNENQDLAVIAQPRSHQSDPDIYISTNESKPEQQQQQNSIQCQAIGAEVCTIQPSQLKQNMTIYISIICNQDCVYDIYISNSDILQVDLGQRRILTFSQYTRVQTIKLKIPNQLIDRFSIVSWPINGQTINETLYMYANQGDTIPSSSQYEFLGQDSWSCGKLITIYKDSYTKFCINCIYTIIIEAPPSSIIEFYTSTQSNEQLITLDTQVYDAVRSNSIATYKLQLISDDPQLSLNNSKIIIWLQAYAGKPSIYLNLDTKPQQLINSKWIYNDVSKFQIELDQDNLIHNGTLATYIYIQITSYITSTYHLVTYFSNKAVDNLLIGQTDYGILKDQGIQQYMLQVWSTYNSNISIKTIALTGHVILLLKPCNITQLNCQFTPEQIHQYINNNNNNNNNNSIIMSSDSGRINIIKFLSNFSECESQQICYYNIAVYADNVEGEECQYEISAQAQKIPFTLREGTIERYELQEDDQVSYKFVLDKNDKSIKKVQFHITSISGNALLFISRRNKYPNMSNREQQTLYQDDWIEFKNNTNTNTYSIQGPYYIQVEAIGSYAYFALTVTVERELPGQDPHELKPKVDSSVVELIEGQPKSYTLTTPFSIGKFSVPVDFPKTYNGTIIITLTPVSGKFTIYISTKSNKANNKDYTWKNNDGISQVVIESTHKKFIRKGTYYIKVELQESFLAKVYDIMTFTDYQFTIQFSRVGEVQLIQVGKPFSGWIQSGKYNYFQVQIDQSDEYVQLSCGTYSDPVHVYVSYDSTNIYPNQYINNISTQTDQEQYIHINSTYIQSMCPFLYSNNTIYTNSRYCYLHLSVYNPNNTNSNNNDIYYTLTVFKNYSIITLIDGRPQDISIPVNNNTYLYLTYYPLTYSNGITISISNYYTQFDILINIYNVNNFSTFNKSKWPTNKSQCDVYSTNKRYSVTQVVLIPKNKLHCEYNCGLAITLIPKQSTYNIYSQWSYNVFGTLNIVATSYLQRLREGTPAWDIIDSKSIKYYIFDMNSHKNDIFIGVSVLDETDADLYLSKGEESRPTSTNNTWSSTNLGSDHIYISNNISNNITGTYVLGVYCASYKSCSFMIILTFSDIKLIDIQAGIPYNLEIKSRDTLYFYYYHFLNTSFTINSLIDSGTLDLKVNSIHDENEILKRLPTDTLNEWHSAPPVSSIIKNHLIINSSNVNFCFMCGYLIGVTSYSSVQQKLTFSIRLNGEPIYILSGKPIPEFLLNGESVLYDTTYNEANQTLYLSFKVIYGNPLVYIYTNTPPENDTQYNQALYRLNLTTNSDDFIRNYMEIILPVFNITYQESIGSPDIYNSNISNNNDSQQQYLYQYTTYGNYYIVVQADTNTLYTITLTKKQKTILLRQGVMQSGILNNKTCQLFEFQSRYTLEQYKYYYIQLRIYSLDNFKVKTYTIGQTSNSGIPLMNIEYIEYQNTYLSLNEKNNKKQKNYKKVGVLQNFTDFSRKISNIQIGAAYGKYMINLTNQYSYDLKYSLVYYSEEIQTLPMDENIYSSLSRDQHRVFEMIVDNKGLLQFKIVECIGQVYVEFDSSYKELMQKNKTEKAKKQFEIIQRDFSYEKKSYLLNVISQTRIYVKVTYLEGPRIPLGNNDCYFRISTEILDTQSKQTMKMIYPGSQGQIKWEKNQQQLDETLLPLKFEFTQLLFQSETGRSANIGYLSDISIVYHLYISSNPTYLNLISRCGDFYQQNYTSNIFLKQIDFSCNSTQECTQSINLFTNNNEYQQYIESTQQQKNENSTQNQNIFYASIRADFKIKSQSFVDSAVYDTIQLYLPISTNHIFSQTILVLGLLILFILVTSLIYIWKKYGKVKRKLEYEMSDVRNIAGIKSEPKNIRTVFQDDDDVIDKDENL